MKMAAPAIASAAIEISLHDPIKRGLRREIVFRRLAEHFFNISLHDPIKRGLRLAVIK